LRPTPLTEIEKWLAPYRKFWTNKLDALEKSMNEEERT
jgi:hypothetical protein